MKRLLSCACLALLALGCTEKPKPPAVNLYGHRGLAVLPFRNTSADAGLARAVSEAVLAGLEVLKPLPVVGPDATAMLAPDAGLIPPAALGANLAAAHGCDLVMSGEVAGYRETVKPGDPRRIKSSYRASAWKWGCADDATVTFLVTVRLAEAATGRQVWLRTVSAAGKSSRWSDLPYDGDETRAPAEGWDAIRTKAGLGAGVGSSVSTSTGLSDPSSASALSVPRYTADSNLGLARTEAVNQAVRAVLNDFTGRGGWTPPPATPAGTP